MSNAESIKGIIIPADPTESIKRVEFAEDKALPAMHEAVGGFIEALATPEMLGPEAAAYIHDEGKIIGLPSNHRATILFGEVLRPGDYIAGNMIVIGCDAEGETISIPEIAVTALEQLEIFVHKAAFHISVESVEGF
jgi:hypothetical protein